MSRKFGVACVVLAGLCPALWAAAEGRQLRLKWSEIGAATEGSKIALVLPSGTHIEGKLRGVDPENLHLRVTKTSNREDVAKGERLIPRQSVSVLHVTKYNKVGRIACTLGAIAAAGIIIGTQDTEIYGGAGVAVVPAVEVLGTAGVGVAGYFIGKRLDRRIIEIVVVPD